MKKWVYYILKGEFLFDDKSRKQWGFFVYVIVWVIIMITSAHRFDKKAIQIIDLNKKTKNKRALFITTRSKAVKLKLETTVRNRVEKRGLFPSETPPYKVIITNKEED
ncbi:MAG: S-adenosyl-methyltransferase [Flavobacteriaceae bacterium]|nr:S-adenosyl-methyltransferase [Flavobacteriaceae bacterium]